MKKTHNIEDILKGICIRLGITVTEIKKEEHLGQTFYVVHTPDAPLLLENTEAGVRAITTILRALSESDEDAPKRFSVDVNNAQIKKIESLQEQAHVLARRAKTLGCEVEMRPMSSYERMIVHETLKGETDIATESRGEGRLRHVVITVN